MWHWLNYGGGRNSTALAVAILEEHPGFAQYKPSLRLVFPDTGDEKPETYGYITKVFLPYLENHNKQLEIVRPKETVLQRWQRLGVTGSRTLRTCTDLAKIRPITNHIKANIDHNPVQLIGIDADESHRARPAQPKDIPKFYPLVDNDVGLDECIRIIENAGLQAPVKSGCWHCPFARIGEVIRLAREYPQQFALIESLEEVSWERRIKGKSAEEIARLPRNFQWHDKPAAHHRHRALNEKKQMCFVFEDDRASGNGPPCGCYDG